MSQTMRIINIIAAIITNKLGDSASSRPSRVVRDSHQTIEGQRITNIPAGTITGLRASTLAFTTLTLLITMLAIPALFMTSDSFAYTASITTSGATSIDVSPSSSASSSGTAISSDSITVNTTCRSGYNLTMSSSVNNNNLYLDGNSSNNRAGTYFSPADGTTTLSNANNTWGYYFNASNPTTTPTSSNVFNAVPALGSPVTLVSPLDTPSSTDISDSLSVYYGVAVSSTLPKGTYKMIPATSGGSDYGSITYYLTMADACVPYTVNFSPTSTAGGTTISGTGTMNPQEIYKDTPTALTTNGFTAPIGYEFKEWNTKQDGTGISYTDGQSVTNLASPGENITLYAQWEEPPKYIYNEVAAMTKGKQTLEAIQEAIETPDSTNVISGNSGVFTYDKTAFGASSDAGDDYNIYYYRGILDSYGKTAQYGSGGLSDAYPNYIILDENGTKSTSDTCWRIVRTTGSGGVKIIYNGTWTGTTCGNSFTYAKIANTAFSGTGNNYAYSIVNVGYKFNSSYASSSATSETAYSVLFGNSSSYSGNNTNSKIKDYVENTWFNKIRNYEPILEPSAGYCNDRTLNTGGSWTTPAPDDTQIVPYGKSNMTIYNFGAQIRNTTSALLPTLACPRGDVDLFTTNTATDGNKQLAYPVSFLTADEATFAGSGSSSSSAPYPYHANSFLRTGISFWTISPSFRGLYGQPYMFTVSDEGMLDYSSASVSNSNYSLRPVISLKAGTTAVSGSGTATDPWVVTAPSS